MTAPATRPTPRPLLVPLLLCILGSCAPALGQSTNPPGTPLRLSLSDAIQLGLENNYAIRIATNEVAAARNNDDYALTGKYPTITLGLSPGINYRNSRNPASVVSQSNTTSYALTPTAQLDWTIFNGGRIELTKQRLGALAELSSDQLRVRVENAISDIIDAYYAARVAEERTRVRRRVLALSRDRIRYQNVRREFGQAGTFDELQTRDAYLVDSTNLVLQQLAAANARRSLLQLLGSDEVDRPVVLLDSLTYSPATLDYAELDARLTATNAQLRTLSVNRRLAELNTEIIRSERAPTLGVTAGTAYDISVQQGTQTFDFGGGQPSREQELPGVAARTLTASVGLSARYLLFDGGSRRVRVQTARIDELTAELDYRSSEQQLRSLLANTYARYDNQHTVVGIARRQIANAERNLGLAEERLRGGTINSFDYRAIQLNYLNAEFQLLSTLQELKATEVELLRLTGQVVD